jgi:uncharacterized protein YciI
MLFVFMLMDKAGASQVRQDVRPVHKAYLAQVQERIAFAGPLLADDGTTMVGSLLVVDFPDRDAAMAWLSEEPFFLAGLFSMTAIHAFQNLWPQKAGFPIL